MIRSMTGYGKADLQITGYKLDLEIKSVNHRYCEISFQNIPQDLKSFEFKIRKILSNRFARGHFYLSFHLMPLDRQKSEESLLFNEELLGKCFAVLSEIKEKYRLGEEITLSHLLVFKDHWAQKTAPVDFSAIEEQLVPLLNKAMTDLEAMRFEEGKSLASHLNAHLTLIKKAISEIEKYCESAIQNYKNRLFKKIDELKSDLELDPQRISHEVVLYSDRMDIQEEIIRLVSHLDQFELMIQGDKPVGRGMDFLIQEMNREINTIGSKTGGTQTILFIKQELEILREQVQNVE